MTIFKVRLKKAGLCLFGSWNHLIQLCADAGVSVVSVLKGRLFLFSWEVCRETNLSSILEREVFC